MNAHPPLASPARRGGFRPRGREIRRLISELKELNRMAEAPRLEIERKQTQLAELVRRDPTFGRAAVGARAYSSQSV